MLEEADLVVGRARKGAPHVAEQLALEQGFDDGRAVHGHETGVRAPGERVKRAGDKLLARPGFAGDEHRADVRRQPAYRIEQLLHGRAAPDHPVKLELAREPGIGVQQALAALHARGDVRQQLAQPVEVDGFAQVVQRPQLDRLHRRVHVGMPGHEDDGAVRVAGAEGSQHLQPADLVHQYIDEEHIRSRLRQRRERILATAAADDVESTLAGESIDEGKNPRLVIDHHEARSRAA